MDEAIQADMVVKNVAQHWLKTKDQICHLSNTNTIKIRDEVIHIDSQLLFKRTVATVQGTDDSLREETRLFTLMPNSSSRDL